MREAPKTQSLKLYVARAVVVISALAAWELLGFWSSTINFAFGRPSLIAQELYRLVANGHLLRDLWVTASEVAAGFSIGVVLGTVCGLALWFRPFIGEVWRPFVVVIASVPVVAFAPALIVVAGTGVALKIVITAMATFFVVFAQSYNGARSIRQEHLEFTVPGQVPPRTLFRLVVLPSSLTVVLASIRFSVGTAVLAAFIGEFISSDSGLGYMITRAAALYNVPRAMAGAFALCVLALTLDQLGALLERSRHRIAQLVGVSRLVR